MMIEGTSAGFSHAHHEQHGDLHLDDGGGSLLAGPDVESGEGLDFVDLDGSDPPDIRWDTDEDGFVDAVSGEDNGDGAYRLVEKLADAAQGSFALAGRRGRLEALSAVTEEDFEPGPERDSFRIIHANKAALFNSKQASMMAALEFFFARDNGEQVSFDLCCEVLGARSDVIRLRIQYEWYLRDSIFTAPFPFDSVPLPRVVEGALQIHGGIIGHAAAREIWVQPGISHGELVKLVCELESCKPQEIEESLERMEDEMLLAHEYGWHLTGRNPMKLRKSLEMSRGWNRTLGGTMHWSALFGRDM